MRWRAKACCSRNHFANAAPCGPSRASLHTGMYLQNHRSGTNGTPLDARHTNWAKEVAAAGYDPVLFGYTDTSIDPRGVDADDPWLRTYEGPLPGIRPIVMMGEKPAAWTDWLKAQGLCGAGRHPLCLFASVRPAPTTKTARRCRSRLPIRPRSTTPRSSSIAASTTSATPKGPFVAHLSILRPHPPFIAPEPYNAMYDPLSVPGFARRDTPDEEAAQHPWLAHQLSRRLFRAPANEKKLRRLKAVYYGLMSEVDAALGRVFALLKETGRWDNTLIVFTSDHGEQMGDHWLLGKCGYFDASYRIPLIVRDPRASADAHAAASVESFTENVDIMPTMLEALGLDIPVQCDGRSLAPVPGRARRAVQLAQRSALGIRFPRSRRRRSREAARSHPASMHDEHRARTALQIRPLHQAAAAVLRSGARPGRICRPLRAIPTICRWFSNMRRNCCPGA